MEDFSCGVLAERRDDVLVTVQSRAMSLTQPPMALTEPGSGESRPRLSDPSDMVRALKNCGAWPLGWPHAKSRFGVGPHYGNRCGN